MSEKYIVAEKIHSGSLVIKDKNNHIHRWAPFGHALGNGEKGDIISVEPLPENEMVTIQTGIDKNTLKGLVNRNGKIAVTDVKTHTLIPGSNSINVTFTCEMIVKAEEGASILNALYTEMCTKTE